VDLFILAATYAPCHVSNWASALDGIKAFMP
jgi:hypothetical protein